MTSYTSQPTTVSLPGPGEIEVIVETVTVTEQQIKQSRDAILAQCSALSQQLNTHMEPYQKMWDKNPQLAVAIALQEGVVSGAKEWGEDVVDLFTDKEMWVDMWEGTKNITTTAYDRAATYAEGQFNKIKTEVNAIYENAEDLWQNPDDTLLNPSWLYAQGEEQLRESLRDVEQQLKEVKEFGEDVLEYGEEAIDTANEYIEDIKILVNNRSKIMELPNHISKGNVNAIERFVDDVIGQMDESLVTKIRTPTYYAVLESIGEHGMATGYMTYMSSLLEAIPPNFYVYVGGKAGTYIYIEIVLLVVLTFISGGAATAARIAALIARLTHAGVKLAKTSKMGQKATSAINALIDAIKQLIKIGEQVLEHGKLVYKNRILNQKRVTSVAEGGVAKAPLQKKVNDRKDAKCSVCKQKGHETPPRRKKRGIIEYDG